MKLLIFVVKISLCLCVVFSCAKKQSCSIGGLNLTVINLNPDLDDTLIVEKYAKGSNFTNLISSNTLIYVDSLDSSNLIFGNILNLNGFENYKNNSDMNNSGFLNADYDYILFTKNHTYQFLNLEILQKTKKCGGLLSLDCPSCYSPVIKFTFNQEQKTISENQLFTIEN